MYPGFPVVWILRVKQEREVDAETWRGNPVFLLFGFGDRVSLYSPGLLLPSAGLTKVFYRARPTPLSLMTQAGALSHLQHLTQEEEGTRSPVF